MRKIVYSAAASLDGYIARKDGSADWIPMDPEIDFGAMFSRFDCLLMGRKTFEITQKMATPGAPNPFAEMERHVFSRRLSKGEPLEIVIELRKRPGKDIWLMGGGELAAEFLKEDLIDGISVAVCPILLGSGIPLFAAGFPERQFRFTTQRTYPKSGIVMLGYERA